MPRHFDTIIVGASLAGAAAAITLAQSGVRVALLDKARFPRHKPCGEGLSALGVEALRQLGVYDQIISQPHVPLHGFNVHRRGKSYPLRLPRENIVGIGIERYLLDEALFRRAQSFDNVETFEGEAVREIVQGKSCMLVRTGDEHQQLFSAPSIIAADGGQSFVARKLGVPVYPSSKSRYGYRMLLQGTRQPATDTVHVFVKSDHEIYCTPVGGGRLNVAILGAKRVIGEMGDVAYRHRIARWLSEEFSFDGVQLGEGLAVGPLCRVSRNSVWGRTLLIGDAVESFDPLGGMGMTHALSSGIAAGEALTTTICHGEAWEEAAMAYQLRREQVARKLRGFTRLTYRALVKQEGALLLPLLSRRGRFSVVEDALNFSVDSRAKASVAGPLQQNTSGVFASAIAVPAIQYCLSLAGYF